MLFRIHIVVLCAIPDEANLAGTGLDELVSYVLGINAKDAADAARIATQAAESAADRDGRYIGGVVFEVQAKCVGDEEFHGYETYLIQPVDRPGIFFVSGVAYSPISLLQASGAGRAILSARQQIKENGIPQPSFIHPPVAKTAPKVVRIVCPVCGHWIEVDNTGLIYSFVDGLDSASGELKAARSAVEVAGPFIRTHVGCLERSGDTNAFVFLYESDDGFSTLEDWKRE